VLCDLRVGDAVRQSLAARLAVDGRDVVGNYLAHPRPPWSLAARLDGAYPGASVLCPPAGLGLWPARCRLPAGVPHGEWVTWSSDRAAVGLAAPSTMDKDADKYAPMPTLGWPARLPSGDLVSAGTRGLGLLRPRDDPSPRSGPSHRVGARSTLRFVHCRGQRRRGRGTDRRLPARRAVGYVVHRRPEISLIASAADPLSYVCLRAGAKLVRVDDLSHPHLSQSDPMRCRWPPPAALTRGKSPQLGGRRAGWRSLWRELRGRPWRVRGRFLRPRLRLAAGRRRARAVLLEPAIRRSPSADLYPPTTGALAGSLDELDLRRQIDSVCCEPTPRLAQGRSDRFCRCRWRRWRHCSG